MISSCAMPSNKNKADHFEQDYAVGDRVKVNMHRGRIVEAEIVAGFVGLLVASRHSMLLPKGVSLLSYVAGD
jgi:hypothetical protein